MTNRILNKILASSSQTFYKSVLIVGQDITISQEIRTLYTKQGYLLIGDGYKRLSHLDLTVLKGKINDNTIININAHGLADGKSHEMDNMVTKELLEKIAKIATDNGNNNIALQVNLFSCYGGAAAPDVSALPPGSILITYAPASNQIQVTESNRLIMKHNNEIGGNGILIDFLNELPHYITQTATVSIHKHDGKIFQHTLRNGHHCSQLTNLNKLLSVELNTFLEHFAQEFPDLDIRDKLTVLEGFSDEDLLKFRNESFIHKTAINDYSLLKGSTSRSYRFQ